MSASEGISHLPGPSLQNIFCNKKFEYGPKIYLHNVNNVSPKKFLLITKTLILNNPEMLPYLLYALFSLFIIIAKEECNNCRKLQKLTPNIIITWIKIGNVAAYKVINEKI